MFQLLTNLHDRGHATAAMRIARALDMIDIYRFRWLNIAVGDARVYLYASKYFPMCGWCWEGVYPDRLRRHANCELELIEGPIVK